MESPLQFLILGPLEIRRGAATLHLGSAKQRALLGMLLLHMGEVISTGRLVDELWGEEPPATAEKLVQGYVHALRKQFGDGVVETRAPGYRVAPEAGSLDLREFERIITEARAAPLHDSVALRERALALWRGAPLANVDFEGASRQIVARLSELRLTTQIEQFEAKLALGLHAQLIGELETVLVANPYQERLAGQLMLALYRSGRQAEALEVYRTIRARLDHELGLEPSQELRSLESAILRQDPSLTLNAEHAPQVGTGDPATAADSREAPARVRRPVFVVALAAAALLAVAAVLGLSRADSGGIDVPPNSVAVIDPGTNRVERTIPVGVRPGAIAEGAGSVWVGNLDDGSLSRIDPQTETVVRNVPLPATPDDVATGAGAVWVVNGRLGTLYRVDPAFGRVTGALRLGERAVTFADAGVAAEPGFVWAVFGDSTLAQVETSPLREGGLADVGEGPADVAVAFGSVWVSNQGDASVQRFFPGTFESGHVRELTVGRRPTGMAAADGAIWVACAGDDYVARLDASPGFESVRTIAVGDEPSAVAAGDDSVWVANSADGTVSRIDLETNQVVATIPVGNAPADIAVVDGAVWVTVQAP